MAVTLELASLMRDHHALKEKNHALRVLRSRGVRRMNVYVLENGATLIE